MFRTSTTLFLAATILTCAASNASAQWSAYKSNLRTKSVAKSHSQFTGNNYLGGYTYAATRLSARKDGWTSRADSSFSLNNHVRFLNTSKRMMYFRAVAHSDNYTSRRNVASVYVYVGNNLIVNRSFAGRGGHTAISRKAGLDLFPSDVTCPFSIAGVPITVRGNIGVGIRVSVQPTLANGRTTLRGYAHNSGYGNASATCGVWGAYARAVITPDFASPKVAASMNVDALNWRFAADVTYAVKAITMKLKVSLTRFWAPATSVKNMAYWRAAAKTISLLRF